MILETTQLKKEYSGQVVLDLPQLSIQKAETVGLIGNNGAGKTTFFRLLLDLIAPSSGEVRLFGASVQHSEHWKKTTGSFVDESFLIDYLSPEEYFSFLAKLYGLDAVELDAFKSRWEYLFNGEILTKKGKYIRDLSKGNMKKVGIAAALMHAPQLLILDEPFANLDPTSQIRLKKMLNEEAETKGTTLLISSHDLNHVTEVCNRTLVLEKGLLIRDIATSENTLAELEHYFST